LSITQNASAALAAPIMLEEPTVRQQLHSYLWESFVTMLRVYAHAAGFPDSAVVFSNGQACVSHDRATLTLFITPGDCGASWHFSLLPVDIRGSSIVSERGAVIFMKDDGTSQFPGGWQDLDTAAISWIEQLVGRNRLNEIKA
jgi:hypothetical protein